MTELREQIAKEFYDAVFPNADWDEPSEYEKEPFYAKADRAISLLESQFEEVEARVLSDEKITKACWGEWNASHLRVAQAQLDLLTQGKKLFRKVDVQSKTSQG